MQSEQVTDEYWNTILGSAAQRDPGPPYFGAGAAVGKHPSEFTHRSLIILEIPQCGSSARAGRSAASEDPWRWAECRDLGRGAAPCADHKAVMRTVGALSVAILACAPRGDKGAASVTSPMEQPAPTASCNSPLSEYCASDRLPSRGVVDGQRHQGTSAGKGICGSDVMPRSFFCFSTMRATSARSLRAS
jgi:hypothetical protein